MVPFGEMGVIERLAKSCENATLAVVVALVSLFAWHVVCPRVSVKSVFEGRGEITAETLLHGCTIVSNEDNNREIQVNDDRESREDDSEPCGLPGLWLVSDSLLSVSQFMPAQSVFLSDWTSAQHPLRC